MRIYSTTTGELLQTIKKHTDWVTAMAFSADGVLLCTGDRASGVHVWEAATAKPYSELKAHTAAVTDIAWRAWVLGYKASGETVGLDAPFFQRSAVEYPRDDVPEKHARDSSGKR